MNPTLMISFLDQVRLIDVAGSAKSSLGIAAKPDAHSQVDATIQAVRVIVDGVLDEARVAADAAVANARDDDTSEAKQQAKDHAVAAKDSADADEDHDDEGSSTVHIKENGKSIVVQRSKSHDDGIPGVAIPIVAITFTFLYLIVRALMAPFTSRRNRGPQVTVAGLSEEEAVLLEKLQRTLAQMENRVESLETILIDQARSNTKEKYGTKL